MTVLMQLRRVVGENQRRLDRVRRSAWTALFAVGWAMLFGCGRAPLPATVEGTLRLSGKPLDNCLIVFFPEPEKDVPGKLRSMGLTDRNGRFRLRCDDQRDGASIGWHRVTIQDMSASTGVRRRDHGTVDAETEETAPPPPPRRSRAPKKYLSARDTTLRKEVKPGHQEIDLEIK